MRLVYIALSWVIGLTIANWFPQLEADIWAVASLLTVVLAILLIRYRQMRWIGVLLFVLMLGGFRQALVPQTSDVAQYNGNTGTIEGVIIDEPDIRDDRIQLQVKVHSIFTSNDTFETSGQILVETFVQTDVQYGDFIRATGALITPAEWDTFSYADYLGRQGCLYDYALRRRGSHRIWFR